MRGRLATGDRMQSWSANVDASCILCNEPLETITHLFFDCSYSAQVWEALMKGVMRDQYTISWERIVRLITDNARWSRIQMFIVRYAFQLVVHTIWRERNRRRHGEPAIVATALIRRLDKMMRNQFTVVHRRGDKELGEGMTKWFETRETI